MEGELKAIKNGRFCNLAKRALWVGTYGVAISGVLVPFGWHIGSLRAVPLLKNARNSRSGRCAQATDEDEPVKRSKGSFSRAKPNSSKKRAISAEGKGPTRAASSENASSESRFRVTS